MIFSTVILSLMGVHDVPKSEEEKFRDYKSEFLYTNEYKKCHLESTTMVFGEPIRCLDLNFFSYFMQEMGYKNISSDMPDGMNITHSYTNDKESYVNDINVSASKNGTVMRVSASLDADEIDKVITLDKGLTLKKILDKKYGMAQNTGREGQFRWGWITPDNYDIRLERKFNNYSYSITSREAYHLLESL